MDASTVGSTACFRNRPDRIFGLAALLLVLASYPSRGQTAADPDELPSGRSAADTLLLPVRHPAMDVAGILSGIPGSFLYDFGSPGWPDGWSPFGMDPRAVGVRLDGIPFEDAVTGAPVWELLPVAQLDPPGLLAQVHGRPDVVSMSLRAFPGSRPLTEMRYRSAGGGLQSVDVSHVQNRSLGSDSRLSLLFGYGGAGARGEYDGSRLRRKRRLLGRVRIDRGDWSYGITNLHNRHRVGAHGGVQPVPGQEYESIYNRLLADVDAPEAQRIRFRNDLILSVAGPVAGRPLDVRGFWTTTTLQYRSSSDTTTARVARTGISATWPTSVGRVPLDVALSGYSESLRSGDAFAEDAGRATNLDASATARPSYGRWSAVVGLGGTSLSGYLRAFGRTAIAWTAAHVRLHGSAAIAHRPRSLVERYGFGATFTGLDTPAPSADRQVRIGAEFRIGTVRLQTLAFSRSTTNPLHLLLDSSGDSVRAAVGTTSVPARGVSITLGLRERAARGVYLASEATWNHRSQPSDLAAVRAVAALPEWHGRLRVGVRAGLFSGDLDLDLAVQARAWSATSGLRLHAPTGLLVLPDPAERALPASAIVDITVDAGVRSATVFLALENVLSGTTIVAGNQLVPDYPYPERRFRFGVFWPIFD